MTYDELNGQFERGEISLHDYLSTPTEPGSFKIAESPKKGRRAAKRQAQLIKNRMIARNIENRPTQEREEPGDAGPYLESNSVCEMCGNEAVPPKSLCCEGRVITPTEYVQPHEIRLKSNLMDGHFSVLFFADYASLKSTGFAPSNMIKEEQIETRWPAKTDAEKFIRDMLKLQGWSGERLALGMEPQRAQTPKSEVVKDLADEETNEGELGTLAKGNLADADTAIRFVTAGNAYFTVRSLKTGTRYTFRVSQAKAKEGYCRWCRRDVCVCKQPFFVSFLSGPENTSDYTYLGWIKDNQFSTTKASARFADSVVFKAFAYVWRNLIQHTMPPQTELWHEGRCGRCGRKLTVPASIEAGIGPECESMM